MIGHPQEQRTLTREQKEAAGLLSIGTFLEYFDLMLYVHMAVLLNELFFPKTDPLAASLISAFTFCITFIFRPLGALVFGWLGDNIGRKSTVIITTVMMALSCFIMATLPTYADIGIKASIMVIICRIIQGISSLGETVGAELYLTEMTRPPIQYPTVAFITVCCSLGGVFALLVAHLAINYAFNWRMAFYFGSGIALIGGVARTTLKETPEFVDAKRKLKMMLSRYKDADINIDEKVATDHIVTQEKVNYTTATALFFMDCTWPFCFYFSYIYCSDILKNTFDYIPEQIIYHNFGVSVVQLLGIVCLTYLSYRYHPLKILKVTSTILFIFMMLCPHLLNNLESPNELFFIQSFIMFFIISPIPAAPIVYRNFPVFKRFTSVSLIFAASRAILYFISAFGLIWVIKFLGYWGITAIAIPTIIGFIFGVYHFENLERENGMLK